MTSSFKYVVDHIKNLLETDTALASYCSTTFGKSLTVRKNVRKRMELNLSDFPLIMMSRPRIRSKQENNIPAYERQHSVFLYCGFHQPNLELGFDQLIEFEEMIDQAVLTPDRTFGNLIDHIDPGESANDEGIFHPICFIVKEYVISREEVY
jgi:hypothetical protein